MAAVRQGVGALLAPQWWPNAAAPR